MGELLFVMKQRVVSVQGDPAPDKGAWDEELKAAWQLSGDNMNKPGGTSAVGENERLGGY